MWCIGSVKIRGGERSNGCPIAASSITVRTWTGLELNVQLRDLFNLLAPEFFFFLILAHTVYKM